MKKFLVAGIAAAAFCGAPAFAADMPTKAPAYAPVAVYNWTGFYVGGHIGGAWSNTTVADVSTPLAVFAFPATRIGVSGSGFLGGVQLGYNWQTGPWVFGVQGDFAWSGLNANGADP